MTVELSVLKQTVKESLDNIAKQATKLSVGLQNAAPPQEGGPGKSILYLSEIAIQLDELSRTIDD